MGGVWQKRLHCVKSIICRPFLPGHSPTGPWREGRGDRDSRPENAVKGAYSLLFCPGGGG